MRLRDLISEKASSDEIAKLREWLDAHKVQRYSIDPDTLEVFVQGNIMLHAYSIPTLPCKFSDNMGDVTVSYTARDLEGYPRNVVGSFQIYQNFSLPSLKGSPDTIGQSFDVSACKKIKSLEGGPRIVKKNYTISCSSLESIKGLAEEIHDTLILSISRSMPLLDILNVKGLKSLVLTDFGPMSKLSLKVPRVNNMINEHLKMPYGMKRIIECQSILIDNELEEFASFGDE